MTDIERVLIGELARRAGLSAKTVRYYESIGLLGDPERTDSGYRTYGPDALERLRFIQSAKLLGLTLTEIKDVLTTWDSGTAPCSQVARLLDEKLGELDRRIDQMTRFRDELRAYKERVEANGGSSSVPCKHIHGVAAGQWKPSGPVPDQPLRETDGRSSPLLQIRKPVQKNKRSRKVRGEDQR